MSSKIHDAHITGKTVLNGTELTATAEQLNAAGQGGKSGLVAAGSSLTLTKEDHDGRTIALDQLDGSTVKLPPATGSGAKYFLRSTVTPTSNAHVVQVDSIEADSGGPFAQGTPDTVDSGNIQEQASAFNSSTSRYVVAWQVSGGSEVLASVGEDNGDGSVTWSTPQQLLDHAVVQIGFRLVDVVDTAKMAFLYEDATIGSDGAIRCMIVTVDGGANSLSFGTPVTVRSAADASDLIRPEVLGYDPDEDRLVALYREGASGVNGSGKVGAISGTSTSWGTEFTFTTETPIDVLGAHDPNVDKWLVVWRANGGTPTGELVARVMTVDATGETATFGTEAQVNGALSVQPILAYEPTAMKLVVAYQDDDDGDDINSRVATISGTNVSFGTEASVTDSAAGFPVHMAYSSVLGEMVLLCRESSSGDGFCIQGIVTGTDVSWADQNTFLASNSNSEYGAMVVFDLPGSSPEAEALFVYRNGATSILSEVVHLAQGLALDGDEFRGTLLRTDVDSSDALTSVPALESDAYNTITMNGTTKGGMQGDIIEIEDLAAGVFGVWGHVNASGTVASPFSLEAT